MNSLLLVFLFFVLGSPTFAFAHQVPATVNAYQYQFTQHATSTSLIDSRSTSKAIPAATAQVSQEQESVPQQSSAGDFGSQVAADVLADTNQQRELNGLPALTQNATLASIAQAHSADMLANNYFTHNDLTGCSPSCRLTNAGYSWQAMGENMYEMSGYNLDAAGTANQIVQGWMNSPEHKANILNSSYTQTSVGIAAQGSTVYATSDYAEPK